VAHPNPQTGASALRHGNFTIRFSGMTEDESAPLLDFLYRHATQLEFNLPLRLARNGNRIRDNRWPPTLRITITSGTHHSRKNDHASRHHQR